MNNNNKRIWKVKKKTATTAENQTTWQRIADAQSKGINKQTLIKKRRYLLIFLHLIKLLLFLKKFGGYPKGMMDWYGCYLPYAPIKRCFPHTLRFTWEIFYMGNSNTSDIVEIGNVVLKMTYDMEVNLIDVLHVYET